MNPVLTFLVACLLALPVHAQSAPSTNSAVAATRTFVGHTLAEADASAFNRFFSLELVQSGPDAAHPGMTLSWYGTTGKFKEDVTLMLVSKTDSQVVVAAVLVIRRDFIDNPGTQIFARDIAKSFLDATTGINTPEVASLRATIWNCGVGCDLNSPAYLTFLGKSDKARITFPVGYVALQNTNTAQHQIQTLLIANGSE